MKFTDLDLSPGVLKSLQKMGFEDMTPIQEEVYPVISEGRDLCAVAETGSGKTAACVIPLMKNVDPKHNAVQMLIIVPTRELCLQYVGEINQIGKDSGVVPFGIYGGFSKSIQRAKLKHEVHALVATPGRLIDLVYDGLLEFPDVNTVILDEADELLNEGFIDDIKFILSLLRQKHQTLLFSATMPADVRKLAEEYLSDPVNISLTSRQAQPSSIKHVFCSVPNKKKMKRFESFMKKEKHKQVIFFCNSRNRVDELYSDLKKKNKQIDYIHGGLSQDVRTSIFRRFKSGKLRMLVATDVAGRGLDFSNVTHIINWEFPRDPEQYTHRTGRAGRMGRKGTAFTFVSKRDVSKVKRMIKKNKIKDKWLD